MRHETPILFGYLINYVCLNCTITDTEFRILKWISEHGCDELECTSLEGECTDGWSIWIALFSQAAKFTAQFNVNWRGIPTYEDRLSNVYDKHDNCNVRTYTMLDQYLFSWSGDS